MGVGMDEDIPYEEDEFAGFTMRKTNSAKGPGPCPRCNSNTVLRKSSFGSPFYGCSNFPKCRGSRDYVEALDGGAKEHKGGIEIIARKNSVTLVLDGQRYNRTATTMDTETTVEWYYACFDRWVKEGNHDFVGDPVELETLFRSQVA